MPVNACAPGAKLTALHYLAMATMDETKQLSMVTWLVEEKGADVTCLDSDGYTAARYAFTEGKSRIHEYLQKQK
jgi:hypothetical protein